MKAKKICILGLGYIGLPTASIFATNGFEVVGVEVNQNVVDTINKGGIHIQEPGLHTLVQAAVKSGCLRATLEIESADVFIIAVPTPITENKQADLTFVRDAGHMIASVLQKDNLVILESTSPPGTCDGFLKPILEEAGLKAGIDFSLAHSPERVIPGSTVRELIQNNRVIGGINRNSAQLASQLYKVFVEGEIKLTDCTTAEMSKLMENTYRDVNIALANELAVICEKEGISAWEVIELSNLHPRVNIHQPGPGVGGHCIAVDPWFIIERYSDAAKMIELGRKHNDSMPGYVVQRLKLILENIPAPKIAVLGVSYKGNIDDVRLTPALPIIQNLKEAGIDVTIYDPHVRDFEYELFGLKDALNGVDCILLLTDHDEFKFMAPQELGKLVRNRIVFDTKNALDRELWQKAGFTVYRLGEGDPKENN
ncbi:MAG: nucleotide sugar dehydrogenase [Clostridiales bacterium]|nr:nucleotide sugar dehydrogenase [Clostridiales bacterium]MCF8023150.1 nucleotide sugar dehydrogenase [Clostridiales bacterium]